MKLKQVILDADMCIKIGAYENRQFKFIEMIIPKITEKAYLYKYVYNHEILNPKNSKIQVDNLIKDGIIQILDEDILGVIDRNAYDASVEKLSKYMITSDRPSKNLGEVKSISMAKIKGIPYFMSDEGHLQPIIDKYINLGIASDVTVFRMQDIILWIKTNPQSGINRKTAKILWRVTVGTMDFFNNKLWKLG